MSLRQIDCRALAAGPWPSRVYELTFSLVPVTRQEPDDLPDVSGDLPDVSGRRTQEVVL